MTVADWQRGYDLATLKAYAALFKAWDAGFIIGAFTAFKERDVATAMAESRLYVDGPTAKPRALVVASRARASRSVDDFAGPTSALVTVGDTVIKRWAAEPGMDGVGGLMELVETLVGRETEPVAMFDRPKTWLHVWQDSPRDREIARSLGFRHVFTKVAASSELVGVWVRGGSPERLPAFPGLYRARTADLSTLTRLSLTWTPSAPGAMRAALDALALDWADHYSGYNKRSSWSALALRGYGGRADFIIKPSEMSKKWKAEHPQEMAWAVADTPLRAAASWLEPLVALVPGVKHRIRLMRLRAGDGELTRHADITDPDAGTKPGRLLRIHVPLLTNPDVRFSMWDLGGVKREAHMAAGTAWYLDTRKPHTARNAGTTDRVHLVLDVESCPELIAALAEEAPEAHCADEPLDPLFDAAYDEDWADEDAELRKAALSRGQP